MSGQAPRPGWAAVHEAAVALVDEAGARGHLLRLVGSTGIRLHCPPAAAALDRLGRPAKDIDVVCRHEDRKGLRRLLEERGWEVDRDLLVAMEGRRYAFRHPASGLELDVFVDRLEFCHTIELRDRLGARDSPCRSRTSCCRSSRSSARRSPTGWTPARVLATHPVAPGEGAGPEAIDAGYVAGLLARDWGFHHTATANLAALRDGPAGNGAAATVAERVDALLAAIRGGAQVGQVAGQGQGGGADAVVAGRRRPRGGVLSVPAAAPAVQGLGAGPGGDHDLLRHRPPRLGDLLPEVRGRGRLLRRRPAGPGRRPHRQAGRPPGLGSPAGAGRPGSTAAGGSWTRPARPSWSARPGWPAATPGA